MKTLLSIVFILLISLSALAQSNGGPAYGTNVSNVGGILPVAHGGSGTTVGTFNAIIPVRNPSVFPTVTYSASAMGSAQTIYGVSSSNVVNTTNFFYAGYGLAQRSTAFPAYNVLESRTIVAPQQYTTSFYYTGNALDLLEYQDGYGFDLYVDDLYVDHFYPSQNYGTLQGATANTAQLGSGASSTNGYYNQYSIIITSGPGVGEVDQIASYVGSTTTTTMTKNWGPVIPTSSSTYEVVDSLNGNWSAGANVGGVHHFINGSDLGTGGAVSYEHLAWNTVSTRKITIISRDFMGVNIGQNDAVWPAPPQATFRAIVAGDSFIDQTGGPYVTNGAEPQLLSQFIGGQLWADGEGGTGWVNYNTTSYYLNFMDRLTPPAEAWAGTFAIASSGTYTISVTYGGSTQTTTGIAYNANQSTIQAAINALSNVPSNNATVGENSCYAGSANVNAAQATPCIIILHGMSGATLTWNLSGLSGVTSSYLNNWTGTLAAMIPPNNSPCFIHVQGSGNDYGGSFTASQIQTNATYTAQKIATLYPQCTTIFTGIVAVSTQGSGGTITSGDINFNNAIKTAAGFLPKINGTTTPFIDTYAAGLGNLAWFNGAGSVANPTNGNNDIMISATYVGHPTGQGALYLDNRMSQNEKTVLGVQ